jgi:hypothetical protein
MASIVNLSVVMLRVAECSTLDETVLVVNNQCKGFTQVKILSRRTRLNLGVWSNFS